MFDDRPNKWLKAAIKAHKAIIFNCFQYKYFTLGEDDFERARKELADIVHEMKLMQAELDKRRGRM